MRNNNLIDKITDVAEELDWCVRVYKDGEIEFQQYTPAGEDFSFSVFGNNPIDEVKEYSANFDEEEHIVMWIEAKRNGVDGVPSIKELVKDAEEITKMLKELSEKLFEFELNNRQEE